MRSLPTFKNRLLTIIFGLAVAIQFAYLLVGFASNISFYQKVTTQTVEPSKLYGQIVMSNEIIAQKAAERGLSLEIYAVYRIVFNSIAALIPAIVAIVIIRRARWKWFAWFTAFVILFLGEYSLSEQTIVARLIPHELFGANAIFWFLVLLFFFLFPDGQVVPPRLGKVVISLVFYHFLIQIGTVLAYIAPEFAEAGHLPNWGNPWFVGPVLVNFILILISQVYRYRNVSTLVERQQTKWFLLGFAITIALIPVSILSGKRGGFWDDIATVALFTPLPISLAFAILRYRLFDIDLIIRRTLVYGVLMSILALAYFGIVTLLQNLIAAFGGLHSAAATVLSTLAIAALFYPLRRHVQAYIDRLFYRRRYDAEQTIQDFAARVRNEVELEQLNQHLISVVRETMQPVSISLWQREPGKKPDLGS